MIGAAGLLFWVTHHSQVSFADGLRYVREGQQVAHGDFAGGMIRAIDHPVYPLTIAAVHAVIGGDHPYAWQKSAQIACFLALILAVIPTYLLARDVFDDDTTAALGCILVFANPIIGYVAVNVLSEATFLLFWMWGLWASARFLREGRFVWLPPAIAFTALAYMTRPEGLLLHAALVVTLLLLAFHKSTRIYWPRWWAAVGLLIVGPAILLGPYVAAKGGLGTKPAIARVIGALPESPPSALEREKPLPAEQTVLRTYQLATTRMLRAFRGAVTWPLIPLVMVGLFVARKIPDRERLWLFFGVIVTASAIGLIRLHATGGYLTVRHALIPGVLLLLTAAHGLVWLMRSISLDGRKLGLSEGPVRPGPAIWAVVIVLMTAWPLFQNRTPFDSSFAPYRLAGLWIERQPDEGGRILDLTDWSLFFGSKEGRGYEDIDRAIAPPETRWLVLREAHLKTHNRAGEIARKLVEGRAPKARFPENPAPDQLQVLVYDLSRPVPPDRVANSPTEGAPRR
jgi:Dolichyl-phosphate-mannose-protein mannosyltransferase